jgi:hypothetical protein
MSLTSYRAAPPSDKPLHALPKTGAETNRERSGAPIDPVRRLPEKATQASAFVGATGMYQRKLALERAETPFSGIL